ncbi:amidase [Tepidicaulis marinus]|uniref:Amidase n=1 Tax=Tepidicaulis marinus TaxID=1333998 RepID=A0A081B7G1_9HYPH|nr:amidase family protein [Tepidicaulis marinus]GAK43979.1 amidase [Tepidicaulis marinus]
MKNYADYDGLGLAALVAKKEVTPLELVDAAIERIEKHNPALNAVVHEAFDEARQTAKGALPDGPFQGVPFLIKDLGLKVAGLPRTDGSHFIGTRVDSEDSELTRRFRASGIVILGKTNTPEYGITGTTESARLGPCRSPWNEKHIAGGSSGGAASAVASGMVPLAHASDGLGSIRIPAACCGLFGMKITRDRNPNGPDDFDRAIGFSVDHVVSRSVRDSAAMLDATGYPEAASPYAPPPKARPYLEEVGVSPGKLKIAVSTETPNGKPIDPEVQQAFEKTVELLKSLGHEVVERGLGVDYRRLYRAQGMVSASNFAAGMRRRVELIGREPEEHELEKLTWAAYRNGARVTGEMALYGWQELRLLNRQVLSLFEEFDVHLSPVMGTPPPEIGYVDPVNLDPKEVNKRQGKVFPFTPPFNFTGQPSMSVPLWQSASGLPIGMMFTGRYGDEGTLFRLAGQLEKECPWKDRRPKHWN